MKQLFSYISSLIFLAGYGQTTLQFNVADTQGAPKNLTRGFLHSVSPQWPPDSFLLPLRPTSWRFAAYGWGVDAFSTYKRLTAAGITSMQSIPEGWNAVPAHHFYGYSTEDVIDTLYRWTQEQGQKHHWNLINEYDEQSFHPGWTYDSFFAAWKSRAKKIKSLDPNAVLIGPSKASFDSAVIRRFLQDTYKFWQDSGINIMPGIVSWHHLVKDPEAFNGDTDIYTDVAFVRSLLAAHPEYPPMLISIEEFTRPLDANIYATGSLADHLITGNRLGIIMIHATWGTRQVDKGPDDSLPKPILDNNSHPNLDGILTYEISGADMDFATVNYGKRGLWWVYKTDADMRGQMVYANNRTVNWDGMASIDAVSKTALALIANRQGRQVSGAMNVQFTNIPSYLQKNGRIRCKVYDIPRTLVPLPVMPLIRDSLFSVTGNTLTVSVVVSTDGAIRIELSLPERTTQVPAVRRDRRMTTAAKRAH